MDLRIETLPTAEWMGALLGGRAELSINTCRYDCVNKNWRIPRVMMSEHLVVFHERGFLGLTLEDRRVIVDPGALIWIPPGRIREIWVREMKEPARYYKMRFNLRLDGVELTFSSTSRVARRAWSVANDFQALSDEVLDGGSHHQERSRALLASFSAMAFREFERGGDAERRLDDRQKRTLDRFMSENVHAALRSADLADHLNLSLDYFSRLFKQTYGMAPRSYLKRHRIRHAASRLLESNARVKELAHELSYDNINLFCRQFREEMKASPNQYRRRHAGRR